MMYVNPTMFTNEVAISPERHNFSGDSSKSSGENVYRITKKNSVRLLIR
jgi:hypothetical protein